LARRLAALPTAATKVEEQGPNTLRAYYGTLETSFVRYAQVKREPEFIAVAGQSVPVASIELAVAMKAGAVYNRGTKRDFIDVHAICQMPGWSVKRFIEVATRQLPILNDQLERALTYFVDAESQMMPRGCLVSWEQVKRDITTGMRDWRKQRDKKR
jgi:hypothetical protein